MNLDYQKIGLKVGLEIHQQLDTEKLFCHCPSLLRKDEPDFTIRRKLHAVAGETGEIDPAVAHQTSLKKTFVYEGYKGTTCLVETDESPPFSVNEESLKIALQIAILLNAKIFPITQIMRKTVVDGSNTSGFQRTLLIARDGFIQTSHGNVGIDSICLEEDSARLVDKSSYTSFAALGKEEDSARIIESNEKVSQVHSSSSASSQSKEVFYRLDRLGIPLIEIATKPEIKNPKQARETALYIGGILRKFKVKRGLGTIRQDVNVSVRKGERVEIKGVQKPELIEKSVEREAERQFKIVSEKKEVKKEVRKVLISGETEFLRPMPGNARMYPETDLPLLKISRELINEVKKNLPSTKDETEELKKAGLNHEMIKLLFSENKVEEFKELVGILRNPNLIAKILLIYPKEILSRAGNKEDEEEIFNKDVLFSVVKSVKDKKISEAQVKQVMEKIARGETAEDAARFEKFDVAEIEEKIHKIIRGKPGLSENAYMGLVMRESKGKISGKEAIEIIKKYVK